MNTCDRIMRFHWPQDLFCYIDRPRLSFELCHSVNETVQQTRIKIKLQPETAQAVEVETVEESISAVPGPRRKHTEPTQIRGRPGKQP